MFSYLNTKLIDILDNLHRFYITFQWFNKPIFKVNNQEQVLIHPSIRNYFITHVAIKLMYQSRLSSINTVSALHCCI